MRFKVLFHGVGFCVPAGGDDPRWIAGFYTTRIVNAPFEEAARAVGVNQLMDEAEVKYMCKVSASNGHAKPIVQVESIKPLKQDEERFHSKYGFTFYPYDEAHA